jgi:hypothetical protein
MLAYINAKANANMVVRVLDGSKDAQEIVRCLRTISYLVQQFQVSYLQFCYTPSYNPSSSTWRFLPSPKCMKSLR